MKKFIIGLFGVLVTVALSVVCTLAVDRFILPTQTDDAHVWDIAKAAIMFYYTTVDAYINDSILTSIPRGTFEQISKVVIGRGGVSTKADIIIEYLKNNGPVYQYLKPDDEDIAEVKHLEPIATDTTNTSKDTVINGKLYRMQKE